MTAVALAMALVVIAFVARDVAVRALRERARERGHERADVARVDALSKELAATTKTAREFAEASSKRIDLANEKLGEVAAKVEKLVAREQLKGMSGR